MLARLRTKLSYANVMASIAVFVSLGGGAYAAITLPANSVGTRQIKNRAVSLSKISPSAHAALKGNRGADGCERSPGHQGRGRRDGSHRRQGCGRGTAQGLERRRARSSARRGVGSPLRRPQPAWRFLFPGSSAAVHLLERGKQVIRVLADGTFVRSQETVLFENSDCTGQAYVESTGGAAVAVLPDEPFGEADSASHPLYLYDGGVQNVQVASQHDANNGCFTFSPALPITGYKAHSTPAPAPVSAVHVAAG